MQITYRVHEWLAKRIGWVQYPKQTLISNGAEVPKRRLFAWSVPMPFWQRIYIAQMSLLLLIVAAVLFFGVCWACYLIFSASVAP